MSGGSASGTIDSSTPLARILIVDDERDIAQSIRKGLEQAGLNAVAFTDAKLVLNHFREHSEEYCLALVDIRMPGINGFELSRIFHQINPNVKKVLMSAFELHKSEAKSVLPTLIVDDFVTKPATINHIKSVILKHIGSTKSIKS